MGSHLRIVRSDESGPAPRAPSRAEARMSDVVTAIAVLLFVAAIVVAVLG